MARTLVDTGPLVAILSSRDQHHSSCIEMLRHLQAPLFSCWPVITESAWLLRGNPHAVQQLLHSIGKGFLELVPLGNSDAPGISEILKKYSDLRAQLADAALVYLANRDSFETIFTLDQRDFSIFQAGSKNAFRVVPEM